MHMQSKIRCTNCEWEGEKYDCLHWSEDPEDRCRVCRDTVTVLGDVHIHSHECPECGEEAMFPMADDYVQEALREIVAEMPEELDPLEKLDLLYREFKLKGWDTAIELEAILNYLSETQVDRETIQKITDAVEHMWNMTLEAEKYGEPEPEYTY